MTRLGALVLMVPAALALGACSSSSSAPKPPSSPSSSTGSTAQSTGAAPSSGLPSLPGSGSGSPAAIVYTITGGGPVKTATIMYTGAGAKTVTVHASLPWTLSLKATASSIPLASLVADAPDVTTGSFGCKITINGKLQPSSHQVDQGGGRILCTASLLSG